MNEWERNIFQQNRDVKMYSQCLYWRVLCVCLFACQSAAHSIAFSLGNPCNVMCTYIQTKKIYNILPLIFVKAITAKAKNERNKKNRNKNKN